MIEKGFIRGRAEKGGAEGRDAAGISSPEAVKYRNLRDRIERIARKYSTVGLTVAFAAGGKVRWTINCGYASIGRGISASDATAYRVASISKTVTAMAVMTLWDRGLVELDRDIGDYLGFQVRNPHHPDKAITLEHLLTHTSGINDRGAYLRAVESGVYPPLEEMLTPGNASCDHSGFCRYRPGSRYRYSNFGYGIIAAIVECVAGERFGDYAKKALFEPLHLDAGFLPSEIADTSRIADIYRDRKLSFGRDNALKGRVRIAAFPVGRLYLLAQGNLYISAPDLAKLMLALMNGGVCSGERILSRQAVAMMNDPRTVKEGIRRKTTGLGVEMNDAVVKGRKLCGHQGRAYGAINEMFYDLSEGTGVVCLSNGSIYRKASNGLAAIGSEIIGAVYEGADQAGAYRSR